MKMNKGDAPKAIALVVAIIAVIAVGYWLSFKPATKPPQQSQARPPMETPLKHGLRPTASIAQVPGSMQPGTTAPQPGQPGSSAVPDALAARNPFGHMEPASAGRVAPPPPVRPLPPATTVTTVPPGVFAPIAKPQPPVKQSTTTIRYVGRTARESETGPGAKVVVLRMGEQRIYAQVGQTILDGWLVAEANNLEVVLTKNETTVYLKIREEYPWPPNSVKPGQPATPA